MKYSVLIAALLTVLAGSACAKKTASNESSAKKNLLPEQPVYHVKKCNFRVGNLFGGVFSDNAEAGGYTGLKPVHNPVFTIYCHLGAPQKAIYGQIGAKPKNGKWIDLDTKQPFKNKQHFKLIKFSGKNWKGIATAVDQIYYAPPERRHRFFNFCLVENDGPQVLCGRTQIRGVTQPPSASKLPKIMAVLKTVVFVDAPASSSTSDSH